MAHPGPPHSGVLGHSDIALRASPPCVMESMWRDGVFMLIWHGNRVHAAGQDNKRVFHFSLAHNNIVGLSP